MAGSTPFDAVEWIARTEDVAVRVNALGPGQATPWHHHTVVTDNVFALDPGIEVALRAPDEAFPLPPGARREIPPGRIHRVSNRSDRPARYLLVQATGRYDFVEAP
jgi:quercetin dioxygenase-like cupin family protein